MIKRHSRILFSILALSSISVVTANSKYENKKVFRSGSNRWSAKISGEIQYSNNIQYFEPFFKKIPKNLLKDLRTIPAMIHRVIDWSSAHPYQAALCCGGLYPVTNPKVFVPFASVLAANFLWKNVWLADWTRYTWPTPWDHKIQNQGTNDFLRSFSHTFNVLGESRGLAPKYYTIFNTAIKNIDSNTAVKTKNGFITNIDGLDYYVIKSKNRYDFSWFTGGMICYAKGYNGKEIDSYASQGNGSNVKYRKKT